MKNIFLKPINKSNVEDCLKLRVSKKQEALVATNAKSLAEAQVNDELTPYGIYPEGPDGTQEAEMVGFTMLEITKGIGFIYRLMVDQRHQGKGYGKAAMIEAIKRLKLNPDVEIIATSHLRTNEVAAKLYEGLGFVPWDVEWADDLPQEQYLILRDDGE